MTTPDTCCTLSPYFKVADIDAFKRIAEQCVQKTRAEPKCLYYGFSYDGEEAHCREGYEDADGLLAHLGNVSELLEKALGVAEITRIEVHCTEQDQAKLAGPLAAFNPKYFTLETGFRR